MRRHSRAARITISCRIEGANPVAIISDSLWKRRLGGDQSVLDQSLILNDQPYQVVGVLPSHFGYLDNADVLVPIEQAKS